MEPEWRAARMENTHAVGPVALYDPALPVQKFDHFTNSAMVAGAAWDRLCLDDLSFLQVLVKTITILCTLTTTVICSLQPTSGNCLTGRHISKL